MGAVWTRARSDLGRHLRSTIAMSVLIGMTSALALTAAAGAHRTDTAYERSRTAFGTPDAVVFSCQGILAPLAPPVDFTELAQLPQVEAVRTTVVFFGDAVGADGKLLFYERPEALNVNIAGAPTIEGQAAMPLKVLEGRLPDPTRADEVAIGYMKDPDPGAAVGSMIELRIPKPDLTADQFKAAMEDPESALGPPIPVKVVGRVFVAEGVELSGANDILVTPTFVQQYRPSVPLCETGSVALKNGLADVTAYEKDFLAAFPGANTASSEDEILLVQRSVQVQVATLWLFALLATLAGFMVFGQALSRLSFAGSAENPILSALGMTRRQLFAVAMLRAAVIGVTAGLVALAASVAASGLFPTGLAGIVEPTPGVQIDAIALFGALGVVLGVLLLAIIPAIRGARALGDSQGVTLVAEFRRPSATAQLVARSGLPASAATGVRLALEPGRGRTTVPVRSAIVGLTMAVVALTAAAGFAASFHHLVETPRLYGTFMNFGSGYPFSGGFDDAITAMVDDPGLSDVMVGNFREDVDVKGPGGSAAVNVWGMETLKGSITPVMTEGYWPAHEGELSLGDKTMRQVGVHIGDTVQVGSGDTLVPLKVVGRTVFGDFGFGPGLGRGAGMTFSQLQAFFPNDARNLFLANLAPGANSEDVKARLNPLFGPLGAPLQTLAELETDGAAGVTISSIESAERVPLALSGLLVLAAFGTLVHVLVMSIRRRRRDLAVLKTLGFVRRQVSATVAWQATTLVSISLLIGLPLGVAIGRWVWTLFANQIGVIPVPVVDLPPLLLAVPVTLLLANLIALIPGRLAAATRPATTFRSE